MGSTIGMIRLTSNKNTLIGSAVRLVQAARQSVRERLRRLPKSLQNHHLQPLVVMTTARPVTIAALQEKIHQLSHGAIIEDLGFLLHTLSAEADWQQEASNLYVASVRALCTADLTTGLEFSSQWLHRYPDPRAIRSLVTYHERAGNVARALGLLELLEPGEWVEKTRTRLVHPVLDTSKPSLGQQYLLHEGYKCLLEDPEPTVLLYGDTDLNEVDDSSLWLASVAEALSVAGVDVHFLLKANIAHAPVLEPLRARPGLKLIEPQILGQPLLTPTHALDAIEALDGIVGGYRAIIVHGMDACALAANRKSLWNRVWAYLPDLNRPDDHPETGDLAVGEDLRDAFHDFRYIFERFLVQRPQVADALESELGVSAAQTMLLPPMAPHTASGLGVTPKGDKPRTIDHVGTTVLAPALALGPGKERKRIVLAGHDLKFIAELESHLKQLGHMVKRDPWNWGSPRNRQRTDYLCAWADIVFCEWALANSVWYSQNLDPQKRLVIRLHSQEVRSRARDFPSRLALNNVDAVVFVSDEIKAMAIKELHWSTERLVTIPNFVNTDIFERPKSPRARYRIGMVGIVPQMKRFDRALDLIALLRAKDPRFELVIKGVLPRDLPWLAARKAEMAYFDAQLARLENDPILADGVRFDEFSPRLSDWYRDIGFVLSPSEFESFHYTVAEGAASGAMPIVWPWAGAEQLYPGEWVIDGIQGAKERILTLAGASDPEWSRWGRDARREIRSRYGMAEVHERLAAVVLGSRADL